MQEKLAVLKNAILRAPDHASRWEIICDGIHGNPIKTPSECEILNPALEAFTLQHFPDFKRPGSSRLVKSSERPLSRSGSSNRKPW